MRMINIHARQTENSSDYVDTQQQSNKTVLRVIIGQETN